MKKILFLFSAFFILSLIACDDNSRQGSISCKLMEIAANSDCLAEDLRFRCTFFGCDGESIRINVDPRDCTATDCATLECESIGIDDGNPTELPGFLMDLSVDMETGFPIGVVQVDGIEEEVLCSTASVGN